MFEHGSDEVILVENDKLAEYLVLPFSDIITQIIREWKPEIALFAADVIVSGGRGTVGDGLKLVQQLAQALKDKVQAVFAFGMEAKM